MLEEVAAPQATAKAKKPRAGPTGIEVPCAPRAFDGRRVVAVGAPPGQVVGLDGTSGNTDWVMPVADGLHYEAVSTASGVSYTFNGEHVFGYDNQTGAEVMRVRVGGAPVANAPGGSVSDQAVAAVLGVSSGGVAIAGGTVWVSANDSMVALRPGATTPVEPPAESNPPVPASPER